MTSSRIVRFTMMTALMLAGAASAFALSPQYADWPKGPVQWLMTSDDQKAWKKVSTDQEAQDFIDLFWARRDPTPGTPRNEFKEQFEGRVKSADAGYKVGKVRGALTDMGRVFIVVGPPKQAQDTGHKGTLASTGMFGTNGGGLGGSSGFDPTARVGASATFEYDNPISVGLDSRPVKFIQDLYSGEYKLDPQSSNVFGAIKAAVQKAVVNPDLTTVPDWARPVQKTYKMVATTKPVVTAEAPAALPAQPAGAHHFTLAKDVTALSPVSSKDPFAGVESVTTFTKNDDLGYAFAYCSAGLDPAKSSLHMTLSITGGKAAMRGAADDVQPEAITVMPGCYMLRGAIPLADVSAGSYHFGLTVEDTATKQTYNLTKDFTVQ